MKKRGNEGVNRVAVVLVVLISSTLFMSLGSQGIDDQRLIITSAGRVSQGSFLGKGVSYLSIGNLYSSTFDDTLRRDFLRFHQDGINVISLSLYWCRLEGSIRGSYDGTHSDGSPYGKGFLDNVKRVIRIAGEYGLWVMVSFQTLWGDDSIWCTPDYVVDPVTGKNIGLAIVRSEDMKEAFISMFNYTVRYLAGTPGIWAWAILNEPWYWPDSLEPPFEEIDQKENFIDLIQNLSNIVKNVDGRFVTVKFCNTHKWIGVDGTPKIRNIFIDDWNWDKRIFNSLDFLSFNAYIRGGVLYDAWRNMTADNVEGARARNKRVWISEFGFFSDDEAVQTDAYRKSLELFSSLEVDGWIAWYWEGDDHTVVGKGMNICADANNGEGRAAYYELVASDVSH